MAVYVDELFVWPSTNPVAYRVGSRWGHQWCHLWGDSVEELTEFAESIGMRASWLQQRRSDFPHFDLVPSKRALALRRGAIATSVKQWREDNAPLTFECHECEIKTTISRHTDPTTATGCCPNCGEKNWNIYDAQGAVVE
jgi:hypothetical protein